jgi:hypothetical protein
MKVRGGVISGSHGGEYEDDNRLGLAPCSLVVVDLRFRGAYFLHYQGDEVSTHV